MRFDVSLIQALAFFIPGAVVLGGLCLVCPGIKDSISTLLDPNPTTAGFIHVAGICFVLGVLTDALRLITIQRLVSCICRKPLQEILKQFFIWIRKDEVDLPKKFAEKEIEPDQPYKDYIKKITSDNLPVSACRLNSPPPLIGLDIPWCAQTILRTRPTRRSGFLINGSAPSASDECHRNSPWIGGSS